jgi:hypothetical protein
LLFAGKAFAKYLASDYLSRSDHMDKNGARHHAHKELERLSGKVIEEIDIKVATPASLEIKLEQFLNSVVLVEV